MHPSAVPLRVKALPRVEYQSNAVFALTHRRGAEIPVPQRLRPGYLRSHDRQKAQLRLALNSLRRTRMPQWHSAPTDAHLDMEVQADQSIEGEIYAVELARIL